jgi:nucleotide-binding universal stress UspA family protein
MDQLREAIRMHEVLGEFGAAQRREMNPAKPGGHVRLKNILYATDFSPAAEKALPFALQIARRYGAKIHVLHVMQEHIYPLVPPTAWPQMEEEVEASRVQNKKAVEDKLRGYAHEIVFRQGSVWEGIQETIREENIDVLVLGTHGRTGLERIALGSIAEQALRHASCPLLMIGPKVSVQPKNVAEWNRILYATDFSTASLAAAPHAISLAREHRAQLILLHCAEQEVDISVMLHTLRDLVPFGSDLRAEPDCVVAHGSPEDKILEVAEEHGANIIVLGLDAAEGNRGAKSPIGHAGIYKIITRATCPVLTVRA